MSRDVNLRRLAAMIIPDGANPFFSSLAQAFQRELTQRSIGLLVLNSDGSKAREQHNLQLALKGDCDALIFVSVGDSRDSFLLLQNKAIPMLVLDREIPAANADFVLADDEEGVRAALGYLHGLGHHKIGVVAGSQETQPGRTRLEAFRTYVDEQNIVVNEEWVIVGDFLFGSGALAARQLCGLPSDRRPTAMFACNDLMAIGFLRGMHENGIRVPEEMSIVGYDDIPFASWVYPGLTTVRQDPMEIARAGVDRLATRMELAPEDAEGLAPKSYVLRPRLIVRTSCCEVGHDVSVKEGKS